MANTFQYIKLCYVVYVYTVCMHICMIINAIFCYVLHEMDIDDVFIKIMVFLRICQGEHWMMQKKTEHKKKEYPL